MGDFLARLFAGLEPLEQGVPGEQRAFDAHRELPHAFEGGGFREDRLGLTEVVLLTEHPLLESGDETLASKMAVEFEVSDRRLTVGEEKTIRFRLFDQTSGAPANNLSDVTVLYYRSDGRGRRVLSATPVGDGLYETTVKVDMPATYYVFVSSPSKGLDYSDLPFFSLMALAAPRDGGK